MKVIQVGNEKYVDQALFDYINNIWNNYDVEIPNDSNIFFAKNTTINRLITDYCDKGISRVIKKEKADYVIINKFQINNYPKYYDGTTITKDDNHEVVYGVYNMNMETQDTIDQIIGFLGVNTNVKYVNQNKLNDSLNNGFVINSDNYYTLKELIDSDNTENHRLAVNMLVGSNLKSNWQWILYLYHHKRGQIDAYDGKNIIKNYFSTLNLQYNFSTLIATIDASLAVITEEDVKNRLIYMIKDQFQKHIDEYFSDHLGTNKFDLKDFMIEYNPNK